jgi:hypothetical protein
LKVAWRFVGLMEAGRSKWSLLTLDVSRPWRPCRYHHETLA